MKLRAALNRRFLLSLAALLAIGGSAHARTRIDDQARLYLLESRSTEKSLSCTATLLKLEDRCRLLTNAHCLAGGPKTGSVRIQASAQEWQELPLLRADFGLDVAELGLNARLTGDCRRLRAIRGTILKSLEEGLQSERVAGFGFFNGETWSEVASASLRSVPIASPRSGAVLLRASDLDTLPGMSGGLLTAFPSQPIALLAHYIPLQRTSFAIPLETIQSWLSESLSAGIDGGVASSVPLPARAWTANVAFPRAGNTHSDGSKNTHSDGGGLDLRLRADPLALFAEPHEGVPVSGAVDEILLGIGPHQIDGWDDYFHFARRPGLRITRKRYGFPEATIREALLDRLAGSFRSRDDFASRPQRRVVARDLSRSDGWAPELEGRLEARLEVDAASRELRLQLRAHELRRDFSALAPDLVEPTRNIRYRAEFSKDSRSIELHDLDSGERLNCENRHYRKLLCRGRSTGFSLSSQIFDGEAPIQFRLWRVDDASTRVDYTFGELVRIEGAVVKTEAQP